MKWRRASDGAVKREYVSEWVRRPEASLRFFVGRLRRGVWYAAWERYVGGAFVRGFFQAARDDLWFDSKRAAMEAAQAQAQSIGIGGGEEVR